ncbi:helix-turn-helix domain containing protein [Microbacter sp. GSS18]|nr:helix-turn-helix domain containing protein [Microbacter sp. GSS18]
MSKTERTREALLTAALELFAERGYAGATTAAIAERAGVSEMTLFRHFPTKDALVVDDPYDPLMAAAVAARPADEPPLAATTRGVRDAWEAVAPPEAAAMREQLRIVASSEALRGVIAHRSHESERAIAAALRSRGADRIEAVVVAAAVIAGLTAALLDWATTDAADPGETIARALRTLDAGVAGTPGGRTP